MFQIETQKMPTYSFHLSASVCLKNINFYYFKKIVFNNWYIIFLFCVFYALTLHIKSPTILHQFIFLQVLLLWFSLAIRIEIGFFLVYHYRKTRNIIHHSNRHIKCTLKNITSESKKLSWSQHDAKIHNIFLSMYWCWQRSVLSSVANMEKWISHSQKLQCFFRHYTNML